MKRDPDSGVVRLDDLRRKRSIRVNHLMKASSLATSSSSQVRSGGSIAASRSRLAVGNGFFALSCVATATPVLAAGLDALSGQSLPRWLGVAALPIAAGSSFPPQFR